MISLNTFRYLLPMGRAWFLKSGTQLRAFIKGLVPDLDLIRAKADEVFLNLFPQTTAFLSDWEWQFGLPVNDSLTEQERRDRLAAAWTNTGGQSLSYIQQLLQDNGFPVFLHEWWEYGDVVSRDLADYGYVQSPHTGWWYKDSVNDTWFAQGQTLAQSMGANAAYIPNATENQWIVDNVSPSTTSTNRWIGYLAANPTPPPFNWYWVSGDPVGYENWLPGEPNTPVTPQLHVVMYNDTGSAPGEWANVTDQLSQRPMLFQIKDPNTLTASNWTEIENEAGGPVFVPGTDPVARDPNLYLRKNSEDDPPPIGYPLVNRILKNVINISMSCGDFTPGVSDVVGQCGEPRAQCGQYDVFEYAIQDYTLPDDPVFYPYFLYIGGETFPNTVQLPAERRAEFETLCLKICPAQQWLGILVEWV